jgi:hypothetical protein
VVVTAGLRRTAAGPAREGSLFSIVRPEVARLAAEDPRPPRRLTVRRALAALLILGLLAPTVARAEGQKLDWETGEGRSYAVPALEIGGFIFGLNQFNRHLVDSKEYGSDFDSIGDNLTHPLVVDRDPFSINQLGHPYQGNLYYGFARSAGLDFWRSLAYTLGGSLLWETAGEITPPSLNDHINTGIGGAFMGEAAFRMASLLLEGGGENPGFWRELGAAILSPPTGFNRLVFGDRFDPVFPSRRPEIFIRFGLGVTITDAVQNDTSARVRDRQGAADYSISYGLPGKPGYEYTRPSTTSTSSSPRSPTRARSPTPSRTCRSADSSRDAATAWATTSAGCGESSATSTTSRPRSSGCRRPRPRWAPSSSGGSRDRSRSRAPCWAVSVSARRARWATGPSATTTTGSRH